MQDFKSVCTIVFYKTYDLAMVVWSPVEAREAGFMLKTLFFHRTSALHLHVIVTDDLTEKIMTTLMNTWELTLG